MSSTIFEQNLFEVTIKYTDEDPITCETPTVCYKTLRIWAHNFAFFDNLSQYETSRPNARKQEIIKIERVKE